MTGDAQTLRTYPRIVVLVAKFKSAGDGEATECENHNPGAIPRSFADWKPRLGFEFEVLRWQQGRRMRCTSPVEGNGWIPTHTTQSFSNCDGSAQPGQNIRPRAAQSRLPGLASSCVEYGTLGSYRICVEV